MEKGESDRERQGTGQRAGSRKRGWRKGLDKNGGDRTESTLRSLMAGSARCRDQRLLWPPEAHSPGSSAHA